VDYGDEDAWAAYGVAPGSSPEDCLAGLFALVYSPGWGGAGGKGDGDGAMRLPGVGRALSLILLSDASANSQTAIHGR
jgi:hypothetical protein